MKKLYSFIVNIKGQLKSAIRKLFAEKIFFILSLYSRFTLLSIIVYYPFSALSMFQLHKVPLQSIHNSLLLISGSRDLNLEKLFFVLSVLFCRVNIRLVVSIVYHLLLYKKVKRLTVSNYFWFSIIVFTFDKLHNNILVLLSLIVRYSIIFSVLYNISIWPFKLYARSTIWFVEKSLTQ